MGKKHCIVMDSKELDELEQHLLNVANSFHMVSGIGQLVEAHFGVIPQDSILRSRFENLQQAIQLGDHLSCLGEALSFALMLRQLDDIRQESSSLHSMFRAKIKKTAKMDDYYGIRMELNVASSLVRKKVDFKKGERPDFILSSPYAGTGIECTSGHFNKEEGDITLKLISRIKNKSSETYNNRKIALFIDITNILHHGFHYMGMPKTDPSIAIPKVLLDSTLGAIILFYYWIDVDGKEIHSKYKRLDHHDVDEKLKSFLDMAYPKGHGGRLSSDTVPLHG